jgi:hypothetical protein
MVNSDPPEGYVVPSPLVALVGNTNMKGIIHYLLIISPGIHVYVYYMVFAKLLQENYLKNLV